MHRTNNGNYIVKSAYLIPLYVNLVLIHSDQFKTQALTHASLDVSDFNV